MPRNPIPLLLFARYGAKRAVSNPVTNRSPIRLISFRYDTSRRPTSFPIPRAAA
uniref:Uncharacterized protein n=1 Tax=Leersia perrieri TaxID=77586 RepID=A0A0D9VHC6_9ORYZ